MSNCRNCGAPMPPKKLVCPYCKNRHDVDLKKVHHHSVEESESKRICPRCNKDLKTINLKIGGKFLIDRCNECWGLFFDKGEMDTLVAESVSNVNYIDFELLDEIKKLKRHKDYPVRYIKCPVCRKFMNRKNYGVRCGVVFNQCWDHGIWLDGGELRQILEWTKAGGQIYHDKIEEERLKFKKEKKQENLPPTPLMENDFTRFVNNYPVNHQDDDIITLIFKLIAKILRFK